MLYDFIIGLEEDNKLFKKEKSFYIKEHRTLPHADSNIKLRDFYKGFYNYIGSLDWDKSAVNRFFKAWVAQNEIEVNIFKKKINKIIAKW